MNTIDADTLEEELQRAHLLCVRREFDEAERLLRGLLRRYPGNPEARYMLGRIASTKREEKAENDRLRAWRYSLNLQTTWRRFLWVVGGSVASLFGLWGLGQRFPQCLREGFGATITTQIYQSKGRYGPGRWVDWTRPLYYDVIYYCVFTLVGVVMLVVLRAVSRGASQWEELDAPLPEDSRYGGW